MRKFDCKICCDFTCVFEKDFKGINGHHPNCPEVNKPLPTWKINSNGTSFLSQNVSEIQVAVTDGDDGDQYIVERVKDMSIVEFSELSEFTGF